MEASAPLCHDYARVYAQRSSSSEFGLIRHDCITDGRCYLPLACDHSGLAVAASMTRLGEDLLIGLNRLAPRFAESQLAAKSSALAYVRLAETRSASSFALFGQVHLAGKVVLDLGCGLGGNLMHLCALGARLVIALDMDTEQVGHARATLHAQHPELVPQVRFVSGDATHIPAENECVDAIISAETFEHVDDVAGTLADCARVLKRGGRLYAYFPPFFSPWGAHMMNWIRLPWCQVLFSEATLVRAARRIEAEGRSTNAQLPAATRLDLPEGDTIPFVNHLTLRRFRRVLAQARVWSVVREELLAPMWREGGRLPSVLSPLTRVPVLQELFTARAVFVLEKQPA